MRYQIDSYLSRLSLAEFLHCVFCILYFVFSVTIEALRVDSPHEYRQHL